MLEVFQVTHQSYSLAWFLPPYRYRGSNPRVHGHRRRREDGRNFGVELLVRDSKQRQLVADVLFHHTRLSSINKM